MDILPEKWRVCPPDHAPQSWDLAPEKQDPRCLALKTMGAYPENHRIIGNGETNPKGSWADSLALGLSTKADLWKGPGLYVK